MIFSQNTWFNSDTTIILFLITRFNLKGEIPWRKIYAAIGATLFIFSDYVLAVNKFCFPVPAEQHVIMVSYYAAQFFIALSVVNSTFVLSPTNSTSVASSNDEKNRNFHVNRTLSEGNLTTNSRVHGKIKDDADLKKNRNDDFHLNGTDSVQDWNRWSQTFMLTVISSAAFCLCLCLQLSIVCIFMFTQQPLCLQLFIILQQHFIVFHPTSSYIHTLKDLSYNDM